jgi:pyruvate kinase
MKDAKVTAGDLVRQVQTLREDVMQAGHALAACWHPHITDATFRKSAENLAHYLVMRRHDLRKMQEELSPLGVSTLSHCEAHVLPTLDALLMALGAVAGTDPVALPARPPQRSFTEADRTSSRFAEAVLGPVPSSSRSVRIMVTLPTEAATKKSWMRGIIEAGADCVRINCAHDEPDIWLKMIHNVREAASSCNRPCSILMDLTGPRARTEDVLKPEEESRVHRGERILLTRDKPVPHAHFHFQARCSLPEVFSDLKRKRRVCFNEGRIGTVVERITAEGAQLKVVNARPKGEKFRNDMALNFPGTDLHLPALTEKDMGDLDFIVRHADLVGYSFVQRPEDISVLLGELNDRRARIDRKTKLGLVAKIETDRAVRNLPEIIVRAAGQGPFAVMIARGDLAVEVGYLRVAELQEEMLWLCEAAHVPVIWATQVLETLAKKGVPTRAEITDAAMAERAECVLLNKGPYILDAVQLLDSVLSTMSGHHKKKTATLRALHSWDHLATEEPVH